MSGLSPLSQRNARYSKSHSAKHRSPPGNHFLAPMLRPKEDPSRRSTLHLSWLTSVHRVHSCCIPSYVCKTRNTPRFGSCGVTYNKQDSPMDSLHPLIACQLHARTYIAKLKQVCILMYCIVLMHYSILVLYHPP